MSDDRTRIDVEPRSRARLDDSEPVHDEVVVGPPRADRPPRAVEMPDAVELPEATNLGKDRVRWGPIWAGVFTAVSTLLLLGLLGLAIGLTTTDQPVTAGGVPGPEAAQTVGIWAGVFAILAFFLGGYVAGGSAAIFGRPWGALNGTLVFLVALPILVLLTVMGLGSALGIVGNFAGAFSISPLQMTLATQGGGGIPGVNVPTPPTPSQGVTQATAWSTLGILLLSAGAAALGGLLATRREVGVERLTGRLKR